MPTQQPGSRERHIVLEANNVLVQCCVIVPVPVLVVDARFEVHVVRVFEKKLTGSAMGLNQKMISFKQFMGAKTKNVDRKQTFMNTLKYLQSVECYESLNC